MLQPRTDNRSLTPRLAARLIAALLAFAMAPTLAAALTLDFEQFEHGEVIGGVSGVAISAINYGEAFDLAVVFDSDERDTRDRDLEAPWRSGNLAHTDIHLGNLLIIQENDRGCSVVGDVCRRPDDEGSRAAGELVFAFETATPYVGFDVIDIDDIVLERGELTLTDSLDHSVTLEMSSVLSAWGVDVVIGDNSANRIDLIHATELDLQDIVEARFVMGGSGALDNIEYGVVPEPGTAWLMGIGLVGLAFAGRRRT